MIKAILITGKEVKIDLDRRSFLNGQERGEWFEAISTELHKEDRKTSLVNSSLIVEIKESI